MAKTLLIKLAETVENSSLGYLGELRFSLVPQGSVAELNIATGDSCLYWDIIGGDSAAHFTDSTGAQNLGRSLTFPSSEGSILRKIYVSNHRAEIRAHSKYGLKRFNSMARVVIDLAQFYGCKSLTEIVAFSSSFWDKIGDISSLRECTNLTNVYLNNNKAITGDISAFAGMTNLHTLILTNDEQLTGDISSLVTLTNLTQLTLNNCTGITGDTSSIAALHPNNGGKLATLNISNTGVTGTWPPSA